MYLLWSRPDESVDSLSTRLRGEVADALVAAGVRGLQVNVDDPAVTEAMVRFTHLDVPVSAVVSVWVDTVEAAAPAVEATLAVVTDRLAGYLVTESVPLPDSRPVPEGERSPGFANVAILRRPEDLDVGEWRQRWQGQHTAVAIDTQSTFGYTQNVVVRPVTEGAPPVDAIVEELFPAEALTDFHAFFDSGGDDDELTRRLTAMQESTAAFGADRDLDVIPTSRYVVRSPFRPSRTG